MRHVRQRDVVDKAAAPDQKARVLLAQHARADDIEPLIRPLLLAAGGRRKDFAGFRHQRHRRFAAHQLDRTLDRIDDVLIAGAAADIVVEPRPDRVPVGIGVLAQQLGHQHQHPRRAVTALQPVLLPEAALQRAQIIHAAKRLDGLDLRPSA